MNEKRLLPVEGHPYLVKDTSTGAILNTDKNGLHTYKKQKALMIEQQNKINKLEADVSEIKELLKKLVSGK